MKRLIVALLLLLAQPSAFAEGASYCSSVVGKTMCSPLSKEQELVANLCRVEMKEANCDAFFKSYPDVEKEKKGRDCDQLATCSMPTKLKDYAKACLENWAGAWGDIAAVIYQILAGDITVSPAFKAREKFFAECITTECKRAMLGPYQDLFTKEEIEGSPYDRKFFDPNDPVNGNHIQGISAKALYVKLLQRLSLKIKNGTLEQPPIEPWSGMPAKALPTADEMINKALQKMGVSHTACYDPAVLAQMRCYAFFTVLDPLIVMGAAGKMSGFAGRGLEKALAKEAIKSEAQDAENAAKLLQDRKKAALEAHSDAAVDTTIKNFISEQDKSIVKLANKNADPTTEFWKDTGVKIDKHGNIDLNFAEVAQNIDSKVNDMIRQGKIQEADAIRPVFVYHIDYKYFTVSPNEIPPKGAKRAHSLLSEDFFYELVSKGEYPMGYADIVSSTGSGYKESAFLHDTNHFATFINNPEFMISSRQVAKKILATKDYKLRKIYEARYLFAAEYSQGFSKKALSQASKDLQKIKENLNLSRHLANTPLAYKNALEPLDEKQLRRIATDFSNSSLATARPDSLGGATHILRHRYAPDTRDPKWTYPVTEFSNVASLTKQQIAKLTAPELRTYLSNQLARTDAFVKVRPQDWMRDGFKGKTIPSNTNTGKLCKALEGLKASGNFYVLYCEGFNF